MKQKVQIVGILNTTPDSYWDGGKYVTVAAAVQRAGELLSEGADIIEVGGESTGPNSTEVAIEEELRRTIPVLRAIKKTHPKARLSIDTYKSSVAEQALVAGAEMVNDVTAGRADAQLFAVVAQHQAKLVLMYAKDPSPRTTRQKITYNDVMDTVTDFLRDRITVATAAGVKAADIIVDPGLGHFVSSNPAYSFEIIARLQEIVSLGYPIFLSPSRKSFLAGVEELPTKDRLPGTIAASVLAMLRGATYLRTHDVVAIRRACDVANAIRQYEN